MTMKRNPLFGYSWAVLIVAALLSAVVPSQAAGPKQPVGTIVIDEAQGSLLAGGNVGVGILTFNGKQYPFTFNGLLEAREGDIRPNMNATGEVYDLTEVSQFAGVYTKLESSIALAGVKDGLRLKNENGVILVLRPSREVLSLDIANSGLTIKMGP